MIQLKEEGNDFEKLINAFPDSVEESDLTRLLDAKISLFSNLYLWMLGTFITMGTILLAFQFAKITNIYLLFIVLSIVLGVFFAYSFWITRINPFKKQTDIFHEYIKARNRLRSMRKNTPKI